MKCPFCGFADSQVKDSRQADDGITIKRRRQCPSCGARFTTHERLENRELKIVKKNGNIRLFDIDKLKKSIEIATRKRRVTQEQIENIVSIIMKKLDQYTEGEVESRIIGELVMHELSKLDEVAYVRYASVYKDFENAEDFGRFIANLTKVA